MFMLKCKTCVYIVKSDFTLNFSIVSFSQMLCLSYDLLVPPRTEQLLRELKAWCDQKHGRQSEIARYLGVPRQAINNWFGGRNWPTGEQVLAIQEFLALKAKDR